MLPGAFALSQKHGRDDEGKREREALLFGKVPRYVSLR